MSFSNILPSGVIINIHLVLFCCASVLAQTCVSPTTRCSCFIEKERKIINCRYRSLTRIPTFSVTNQVFDEILFTSTEATGQCHVSSGCNSIQQLGSNAFANLKVKMIDLRNNPIASIDANAFTDLTAYLDGLLLEGDRSNDLPYQALAPLEHLKTLHLEGYGDVSITPPVVLPFPHLRSLTIKKWNNLNSLNTGVFRIAQNVSEFKLHNLPALVNLPVPAIQMFQKLTTIDVMDTGIISILGEVFAPLSRLSEVKIHNNNNLNSLDQRTFYGVTDTVQYLDLDNNKLNNIEFLRNEDWAVLNQLNIGYNYDLGTFPAGIFNKALPLEYITCQDIGLTRIDASMFSGLSNLHTLDLAYNRIKTVGSRAFRNSPALVELRLHDQTTHGDFIVFQNNPFGGIETSVEVVSLGNNRVNLTQFWNDIAGLTHIKVMELVNIGIVVIPDQAFRSNTHLNTLLLSDNIINTVNQETFYGPRNTLHTIDLQGNNIHSVDECTLNGLSTNPTMKLANNPLNCNCDLVWLYDWWNAHGDQTLAFAIGTCATPSTLANLFFDQFTRADMCPGGVAVRTCRNLYSTTTSSTTTTASTTASPITLASDPPTQVPSFELFVNNVETANIQLIWLITHNTYVTRLKLTLKTTYGPTTPVYPEVSQNSYTFHGLQPDTFYIFCLTLEIKGDYKAADASCKPGKTLSVPPATVIPFG